MRRPLFILAAATLAFALTPLQVVGQAETAARAVIVPVDDVVYQYIERLQRRGHMLELNPTILPYTRGAVADALEALAEDELSRTERLWFQRISAEVGAVPEASDGAHAGAELRAGSRFSTTSRLDVLRPTDEAEVLPFASVRGHVAYGHWAVQLGVAHDRSYVLDPEGVNPVRRLEARNEENYVGYAGRYASAYIGRYANHWAPSGSAGLLVSENPRSYDHISFRIGTQRLSLQSIVGELDALSARGEFTGRAFEPGSIRRYVSAHRIDWRPRRNIAVTFMEAGLFSGQSSGFSLKYLNPIQVFIFAIDNQPKNDENKGLVGGNLWMQFGRATINGQLLVDDIDIMGQTGEPISFGLSGMATLAELLPTVDAGVVLEVVTSRTYNTHQKEGQYLYMNRGLATNFSDYIRAGWFADIYADGLVPGLRITPRVDYLAQGEFDMRLPYPANVGDVDAILAGTPEHTVRVSGQIFYQPSRYLWIALDPGINMTRNAGHEEGTRRSRFTGVASFGLKLPVSTTFSPDL